MIKVGGAEAGETRPHDDQVVRFPGVRDFPWSLPVSNAMAERHRGRRLAGELAVDSLHDSRSTKSRSFIPR